eukprot:SAG31_NODE_99_length_25388_cov_12.710507_9_plen_239_part_00
MDAFGTDASRRSEEIRVRNKPALHDLCAEGDVEAVNQFLASCRTAAGDTAAADSSQGHTQVILSANARKLFPLHAAAANGHAAVISALLHSGAIAVNARNRGKRTALHTAVQAGHRTVISALIAAHADCNAADAVKQTPLHFAAMFNRHENVAALVQAGARIEAVNLHQATPLHRAAEAGSTETVVALLDMGASISSRDSAQRTPLHVRKLPCQRNGVSDSCTLAMACNSQSIPINPN